MAINRNVNSLRHNPLVPHSTKLPAIARPRAADPEMQRFIDAVVENLEVRNGSRGDPVDKGVTFRDLQSMGLDGNLEESLKDVKMDAIPVPVGLEALGGPGFIEIKWLVPEYAKHQHTEIWRSDSEDFALASQVGVSRTTAFLDFVGFAETRHYWIRYVNVQDDKGVFSPESVSAETGAWAGDPWDWTWIEDWLENHPLYKTISSPIAPAEIPAHILIKMRDLWQQAGMFFADMDRAVDAQFRQLETYIFGEGAARAELEEELFAKYGSRGALIKNVFAAIATETEARAAMEQTLIAKIGEDTAAVLNLAMEAVADETSARVTALESLYAQVSDEFNALIASEREVTTTEIQALATTVDTNLAQFGNNLAAVQSEVTAVADSQSATATKVDTLEANLGTESARISNVQQVVSGPGGLTAQKYVKTDVNGVFAGYGLYNGGGDNTAFIVNAHKFAIGSAGNVPFYVEGSQTYIKDAIVKSLFAGKITGDVCTRAIEVFGAPNYSLPTYWYDISSKWLPAPTHPGGHYPVAILTAYITSMNSAGTLWTDGGLELKLKIPGGQTTTQGIQFHGQAMVPISYCSYYSIGYSDNYVFSVRKTVGVNVKLAIGSCICWGMR